MVVKLLLIEDVDHLGRSGDIVSVKPGYARNFLFPQGKGVRADKNALRRQEFLKQERLKKAAEDRKESEAQAKIIEGAIFTQEVKVDPEGHMYGSVSAQDIIGMIKARFNIEFVKKSVQLKHAIKATGTYTIGLNLNEGVKTSVQLKIFAEGSVVEAAAE